MTGCIRWKLVASFMLKPMKTLIIGLGNPILTDDGVGVKVAWKLEKIIDLDAHPELEITEASAGGLRLMEFARL